MRSHKENSNNKSIFVASGVWFPSDPLICFVASYLCSMYVVSAYHVHEDAANPTNNGNCLHRWYAVCAMVDANAPRPIDDESAKDEHYSFLKRNAVHFDV